MNNYNYGYNYYDSGAASAAATGVAAGLGFMAIYMLFMLALMVFMLVCMWKIFKKAGKNGWEAIIPIYNVVVMLEIAELPIWYIALFFVPFANIYAMFKIYIEIAHKFGKSTGFGVAMVFFGIICLPILAFGSSTYKGVSSNVNNMNVNYNGQNVQPQPQVQYSTPQVNQPVQTVEQVSQAPENLMAEANLPQMTEVTPFVEPTVTPEVIQPVQNEVVNAGPTFINPEPASLAPDVKYCPHCGNQVVATDTVCNRCNNNL